MDAVIKHDKLNKLLTGINPNLIIMYIIRSKSTRLSSDQTNVKLFTIIAMVCLKRDRSKTSSWP